MESWFNRLKKERVFHRRDQTGDEAKADLFDHIDVFYNRKRCRSGLGYGISRAFHSAWLAQQKLAA